LGGRRAINSRAMRALACGAVLLAPVLSGCGTATTSGTAAQPKTVALAASLRPIVLRLDVGSYTVSGPVTTLRGSATRGASVEVNDQFVPLQHGRWQRKLQPHVGANRVVVRATMSRHAPVVRTITVTRDRTAAEIEARALATSEAEARATTEREAHPPVESPTGQSQARETEPTCSNGTYVNSAGNTVCKPEESPTVPAGATAKCADGTYSFSESRSGTCSHHGGVAEWLSG
jgi:hypothetical protein